MTAKYGKIDHVKLLALELRWLASLMYLCPYHSSEDADALALPPQNCMYNCAHAAASNQATSIVGELKAAAPLKLNALGQHRYCPWIAPGARARERAAPSRVKHTAPPGPWHALGTNRFPTCTHSAPAGTS